MNIENVAKWVAALRSGEYEQGNGRLHYEDSAGVDRYCCLGVAAMNDGGASFTEIADAIEAEIEADVPRIKVG